LVPFTGAVNVGVASTTSWLDRTTPAPLNKQYLDLPDDQSAFDVLESMNGGIASNWGGCVRSRFRFVDGIDDLDLVDTLPNATVPDTLFSAYFDTFSINGSNSRDPQSYAGVSSNNQNSNCPDAPIQPLTNVKTTITDAINSMTADGSTNIPEALAWGWRTISPTEPFAEGKAYSDSGVIKAIILLTDGNNEVRGNVFSSYGESSGNPQLGADVNNGLNTKTRDVCTNIKANQDGDASDVDILLYTIVFNLNAGPIIEIMQNCATSTSHYFNSPNEDDLDATFQTIAASLNQLRIKE
jgi:hypothetical protein